MANPNWKLRQDLHRERQERLRRRRDKLEAPRVEPPYDPKKEWEHPSFKRRLAAEDAAESAKIRALIAKRDSRAPDSMLRDAPPRPSYKYEDGWVSSEHSPRHAEGIWNAPNCAGYATYYWKTID